MRIESGHPRKARSHCSSDRALAMAICAGGFKKSQHPWQIVSTNPEHEGAPQGAKENFPSEILQEDRHRRSAR
jgi:hypothetical protein